MKQVKATTTTTTLTVLSPTSTVLGRTGLGLPDWGSDGPNQTIRRIVYGDLHHRISSRVGNVPKVPKSSDMNGPGRRFDTSVPVLDKSRPPRRPIANHRSEGVRRPTYGKERRHPKYCRTKKFRSSLLPLRFRSDDLSTSECIVSVPHCCMWKRYKVTDLRSATRESMRCPSLICFHTFSLLVSQTVRVQKKCWRPGQPVSVNRYSAEKVGFRSTVRLTEFVRISVR